MALHATLLGELADMDDAELVAEIGKLADKIDHDKAILEHDYEVRRAMFREGRRREPPIVQRVLAEAARVSDVAVVNAVRD